MNRGLLRLSAAALALGAATACAPTESYNGFRPERNDVAIADPQPGVDTRTTVQQRFGSPSTTAVFDQNAWYYVDSVQQRVAFYDARISERHVMVVHFNGDTVASVEKFGLERGRVISYDDHTTPTRGRELGILEQLLGNVGSTPVQQGADSEDQGPRRGRTGNGN
jgi:outer membrane protein assembly factor BamE (lipoprotein component of BamABCDE complex)